MIPDYLQVLRLYNPRLVARDAARSGEGAVGEHSTAAARGAEDPRRKPDFRNSYIEILVIASPSG